LINLNKNINRTYTGTGKINGEDSICILGGPKIHVVQPSNGSTAGFQGMTDMTSRIIFIVIVIDYLAVEPSSAPDN